MKVAPAAIPYLRRFAIMPAHVKGTGPRGHVQKGDVLAYAKRMNLQPLDLTKAVAEPIPTPKVEPKAEPKTQAAEPA